MTGQPSRTGLQMRRKKGEDRSNGRAPGQVHRSETRNYSGCVCLLLWPDHSFTWAETPLVRRAVHLLHLEDANLFRYLGRTDGWAGLQSPVPLRGDAPFSRPFWHQSVCDETSGNSWFSRHVPECFRVRQTAFWKPLRLRGDASATDHRRVLLRDRSAYLRFGARMGRTCDRLLAASHGRKSKRIGAGRILHFDSGNDYHPLLEHPCLCCFRYRGSGPVCATQETGLGALVLLRCTWRLQG